jgi:hypothetical protein
MKYLLLKKAEKNCLLLITLLIGSFGYAQIAQRGTATTATTTNSSLTVNKPSGVLAGDVMIANILHNDTSNNITLTNAARSGWALINGNLINDAGNNSWRGTILYRVADGTEGASFVFTLDATTDMGIGSIIAFSNVDTTRGVNENGVVGGPFDLDPGTINVTNSGTSTANAITTATNNAAVIMLTQIADNRNQNNWLTTSPGTLTELYDDITANGDDGGVGAAWAIDAIAGNTGAGNSTIAASVRNGAILLALKLCLPNTISLSSSAETADQTVCINSAITDITYDTTGATGATFSGLPAGVTGNWNSNVVSISGTPTVSGTFPYTVTLTGGCGAVTTAIGTITVIALPTITGTTSNSRTGAGSLTLGATASLGTVFWYANSTGGSSLGSGTNFVTPVISETTIYYVETVYGACTSPTRVQVTATINYPEIDIQGNATSIVDGDSTPTITDWTDFGTANSTRTFTIRNTGTSLLKVGSITFSGTNASEFIVTSAPSANIPVGSSSTFTVTFTPTAIGLRTANISIANNDTNENPYDFAIQGTGSNQEIDIRGNSVSIIDGDTTPTTADWTDFSSLATTRTFTIFNTGNIALTIGTITINGTNASDFTVTSPPATSVAANSNTTFIITFSPSAIGSRTATISIVNNDSSENPYDFAIQGFGIIPEIDVQGNTTSIADGDLTPSVADWTDFGSSNGTRTFTILNSGNFPLTIGTITITGANASEFTVTTPPSSAVPALSYTTFEVTFIPTAIGARTANISIVNDDTNENPYNFNIQGIGSTREIDLQGNGLSIANGDLVTSVSDHTDFGSTDINLATVTRTFTIRNTGSLPLTIANPTISGLNAAEFSITANPGTLLLGAGASTTFQLTFNPSSVFTRVAQINIVNNDSDENPYFFAIQGTGLLDNDGDGIENNTDQDDDNDGITDTIECGACISDTFVNGSFETPTIGVATYSIAPTADVTGWQTSAEPFIEIWSSGFSGGSGGPVPAATGNQFAELNANVPGILYQTFCLNGAGGTINWAIKHRGRAGTDTAYVKFGNTLANAVASSPIVTMVDGNTSWGSYSGTYNIPLGQTSIVLTFQAGPTASGDGSVGNFIDDVQILINQNCIDTDSDGIADLLDVDDENDGIPDIEEAGFKAYSNGKSTMDRTSAVTWLDANNNGINDYIETMISGGAYLLPDTDSDGIPNYLDLDSDNDSFFDVDESGLLNGDGDITGDGKGDGLDSDGDGLLDLYDNSTVYGTTTRAYAQDTDGNNIPDYLELDSDDDGVNDIQTGLYASFDTNADGRIDGSGDADLDGILDVFDTDDAVKGSPRDLNRKLFLDFDGRNDYAENVALLGGLANATLMAWVDLNSSFSTNGVIVGQDKFQLRINSAKRFEAIINGTTVTYDTALTTSQWYHVAATYGYGNINLYLNGKLVATQPISGNIAADATKLTLGRNPAGTNNYFKGKIDEVRVFNVALTATQVQRMVYQEIQNTASQVRGAIVPKDIESLPYANVLRNYRMDVYKDDIVDDLTTASIDTGTGMKLYNHKVINVQEAPMPFITIRTGTLSTAVDDVTKDIRGFDVLDYDYSIIQVKHDITETSNSTDLAMFVDPGVTINMTNDTKIQNDWYLQLNGKIDLQGKSQLVQTTDSDLDVSSSGLIERDQQGQANKFNYNYWSSPVCAINSSSNNTSYNVNQVMRDGTDPNNIRNITWTPSYDSAPTTPITLSSYWIFKFQNLSPVYANWGAVGQYGSLLAGQGFTMKGVDSGQESQNYTFVGKPNNGTISIPIAANNLNLSGNPYASALDADVFIFDNLTSTTGAIYFWEHYNTNPSHILLEYQGGYAVRNLIGGVPPVSPAGISGLGYSTRIPERYIPVGQGFLMYGSGTGGAITFNNSQRSFIKEDNESSNIMFRNNLSAAIVKSQFDNEEDEIINNNDFSKIRLGFNSVNGYHRQILLGFMDNLATEGFDSGYDAPQLDSQPNDFYFSIPGSNLVIQGVDAFDASKILPLSVKNGIEGNVQFTLDVTENFDENHNIYIHDNITDYYHDIRNGNFEINLPIGTFDTRFSLRFMSQSLSTSDFNLSDEVRVTFTSKNDTIHISNSTTDATVKSVDLYNILGQLINSWEVKDADQKKIQIPVSNVRTGTYIVKVHTTKGDLSNKIIID